MPFYDLTFIMRILVITIATSLIVLGISLISKVAMLERPASQPNSQQINIENSIATIDGMEEVLEQTKNDFHEGLGKLEKEIKAYNQLAQSTNQLEVLQQQHIRTRQAFKMVEWLLEYIDPTSIKRYINGAPLPKTEPKVPEIVVIEPKGLQTLDELVFADEADMDAIRELTAKLEKQYGPVKIYAENRRIQHSHVFEALKLEVVRIFTLGVTGFDTPASGVALEEALATSLVLKAIYAPYGQLIRSEYPEIDQRINAAFDAGIAALKASDFDEFDRLAFLVETINPLTENLIRVQEILQIEFSEGRNPVNTHAKKLFAANWLNADIYSRLAETKYDGKRAELGKILFFDPILSGNNKRACAGCHLPEKAFTDGRPRSLAIDGKGSILRNSPSLINAVYAEKFFYDLREERLDRQIKHVVHDSLEFGTDFIEIADKLGKSETYRELFNAAYPDYPEYAISRYSVSDALAHYVKQLRSHNSLFDQMARGEIEIDQEVAAGFNLFAGKAACATCHFTPTFSGLVPPYFRESESEVLGVPSEAVWENAQIDPDLGRLANSKPQDNAYFHTFAFKTPTIRNVALTAPYMHNGVYGSLEEVLDFYNRGGGAGIGSFVDHQTLPPDSLNLQQKEIDQLIVFMHALTDTSGLTDYPDMLPMFEAQPAWNERKIGGEY